MAEEQPKTVLLWPGTPGPWYRVKGERMRADNSAQVRGGDGLYVAAALDKNRYDRDAEVEANALGIACVPQAFEAMVAVLENAQAVHFSPGGAHYRVDPLVIANLRLVVERMLEGD